MRRSRWILLFALLALGVAGAWLWWVSPKSVDMAAYAPAESLVYLESNRPMEIVDAINGTQAWRALASTVQSQSATPQSHWLRGFIGWTGIGPIKSVILARAQVAVVVTDLRAVEEGDSLNIKSEGAILIETHTSERRIRATFEETIKALAEKTYDRPTSRRVTMEGVEYSEWIAPEGSRQIVGAVFGSLVIIGTNEHIVQECLAVSQGRRPSLKDDPELRSMRLKLEKGGSLSFGYVPAANSARLLAVGLPLLLGRAPGDSEFQRLITSGASKVFGSLGWISRTYLTGIEDQYLITLQPSVVEHLKPTFAANTNPPIEGVLPDRLYSVTSYRFANPAAAWISLKTAVSSQVDALSAIVFSSLLKSTLLSYGIDDPESFLGAIEGELQTLRLDESAERSIVVAGVHNREALHQLLSRKMLVKSRNSVGKLEIFEDQSGDFAAALSNESVVMGSPADVRSYSALKDDTTPMSPETLRRMTFFLPSPASGNVVTYTNDGDRVRSFISAIISIRGEPTQPPEHLDDTIATLPYSSTETTLGARGIERTTRSPLGQFSTLVPLLFPQQPRR